MEKVRSLEPTERGKGGLNQSIVLFPSSKCSGVSMYIHMHVCVHTHTHTHNYTEEKREKGKKADSPKEAAINDDVLKCVCIICVIICIIKRAQASRLHPAVGRQSSY